MVVELAGDPSFGPESRFCPPAIPELLTTGTPAEAADCATARVSGMSKATATSGTSALRGTAAVDEVRKIWSLPNRLRGQLSGSG